MPRNNWGQFIQPNTDFQAPSIAERVESIAQMAPVEGSVPEVAPSTTMTFDGAVPEGSLRGVEYPAYTGPQWVPSWVDWHPGSRWGTSDPLAQPQQRTGPGQESIHNWYVQGQHSRLPTCCIEFFCTRWAHASQKTKNLYTRLLKKMHEDHKYLWQPGFIPCPKTIRAKDIVFMHHCDDRCRAAVPTADDIRRAKEQLMRSMYGGGNVVIDSGPTIRRFSDVPAPVQEMRNQREDNARLSGSSVVFRPRP